jgi:glycosyltransferase involved in cell wall biosynthesis
VRARAAVAGQDGGAVGRPASEAGGAGLREGGAVWRHAAMDRATTGAARPRIALVIRGLAGRAGGAERLYCEMAGMFAAAGYPVTCLHLDASDAPPFYPLADGIERRNLWRPARERALVERAAVFAGRLPRLPAIAPLTWLGRNLAFVRGLVAAFRALRPDVVVSFLPPANTPALLAGRLTGTAVIPTNHNVPSEDYGATDRWEQNPIDRALRLRLLDGAARIHVLFPAFAAGFPAALRPRIVAIPNYVAPALAVPAPEAGRRPVVLSVGRLTTVKDHATLIDAWAALGPRRRDWLLRVHGDGPEHAALAAQIVRLGVGDAVDLAGPTADIGRAYREASILAHPARFEGFGLAVAEGMASGLPVVAFADCAGVREYLRDGEGGLLADRAGGPAALADALARLIADPGLRARLGAGAIAAVAPFSLASYRDRWFALVEDVAARR